MWRLLRNVALLKIAWRLFRRSRRRASAWSTRVEAHPIARRRLKASAPRATSFEFDYKEGTPMKTIRIAAIALVLVLSSSGGLLPSSAQAQPSIQIGPGGVRVDDGRARRGGGQCEELRLACENKDRLGEQGEGNCRRYRQMCQRQSRREVCEELRAACLNKDQLGEQGEGNCRRYRTTCRR